MFPNVSDNHWEGFSTHIPTAELEGSGMLRGSKQPWTTVDKKRFAIVSMFRRLEYLLWGGVNIYTYHRNLAYIFELEACVLLVPKTAAQRLENWKMILEHYDYTIMHISDERKCCSDLLSRCVNVPAVAVRAVVVFTSSALDEICRRRMQFVRYSSRLGLAQALW